MSDRTIIIILATINIMLWIFVFDLITKMNKNNIKHMQKQIEYYSKTFQNSMGVNEEISKLMHQFVKELRTAFLEENDKVQSKKNDD